MEDDKIFLVQSLKKSEWILPKGGWEDDETIEECAKREAYEECGVVGDIDMDLHMVSTTDFTRKSGKSKNRVTFFVLNVTEVLTDYPEASKRPRKLFTVEEASKELKRDEFLQALNNFIKSREDAVVGENITK